MITPVHAADGITIYCADYVDVIGDGVREPHGIGPVDAVITDPPYNTRTDDITLPGRSAMRRDFGEWDAGEFDPMPFLDRMWDVTRKGGSLIAFTSDRLLGRYRRLMPTWTPRGTLIWIKANPAPHPRPQYVQATEFVVWMSKPGPAATWNGSGYVPNVLYYPVCGGDERTEHPTQKPEALMMELITRHTNPGDLILDPFMGSGTTLAAAKRLGRRAIGIDINAKYCELAAARLRQSALPFVVDAPAAVAQPELFTGGDDE